jgi:hypothetical protein
MRKGLTVSIVCAGCAFGQTPGIDARQVVIREFGSVAMSSVLVGSMGTVAGAPYSAQATTQRLQVLADGNRIEQTTSGSVARDSQGRVRRDEALPGLMSNNGDAPHIVMIDDPVAQVHWTLDAQTKTAMKMPAPGSKGGGFGAPGVPPPLLPATKTWFYSSLVPAPIAAGKVQIVSKDGTTSKDPNVSETDLGTQNIEGVSAQGKRMTQTIPAGQAGNEQPIVITTETWYSPELKVLVMSKSSDPRIGETTYKLTNIQRSEPAGSLFQVPDDYTTKDQPENKFVYQETKRIQ